MLGPFAVLVLWGAAYLFNCVQTLAAPTVPIRLDYKSPGGNLQFTASSFAYDLRTGNLLLTDPKLTGPHGLIAMAIRVDATGLQLDRDDSVPIRVAVSGARATILRQANGRFEIADFLPKRVGPPSKIPYSVRADDSKLRFIDETGLQPVSQLGTFEHVEVDGVGNEWVAEGSGSLQAIGRFTGSAQNVPAQGLYVRGDTAGFDLAPALERFRSVKEGRALEPLRHLQVGSIRVAGPFSAMFPQTSALAFNVKVKGSAINVGYDQYKFEHVNFDGLIGETGVAGKGDATSAGMAGTFDGSVTWGDHLALGAQIDVHAGTTRDLPSWLKSILPQKVELQTARYQGWLAYQDKQGISVDGDLTGAAGSAYGEPLTQPKLQLHADRESVRLGQVTALWHGSPVAGALEIGLKDHRLAGAFKSPKVDLASLTTRFKQAAGLGGAGDAQVLIAGTTANPDVDFQFKGQAEFKKQISGSYAVAGRYADRVLVITRGVAETRSGSMVVEGTVDDKERIAMRVSAADLSISPFIEGAKGNGSFIGRVEGTLQNPRAHGRVEAYAMVYRGHVIPFASGQLEANSKEAKLTNFDAQQGPTEVSGHLAYRYRDGGLNGELSVLNFQPSEFLGEDYVGLLDAPNVAVGGTVKEPIAAAKIVGTDLFYQGRRLKNLAGSVVVKGPKITLDDLTANLFDGSITATGSYDLKEHAGSADLVLTNLGLAKLASMPTDIGTLKGGLNGTASLKIDSDNRITGQAAGDIDAAVFNGTSLGAGEFDLALSGPSLSGSLQVGNLDRYQRIDHFAYNFDDRTLDATLLVANTPLFDFYRATRRLYADSPQKVLQVLRGTSGMLNLEANVHGAVDSLDANLKTFEIADMVVQGRAIGDLKASGVKHGDNYQNLQATLRGPAGNLTAKGSVDLNGDLSLDSDLADFDISTLGIASDSLAALRGKVTISLTGKGPSHDPTFHGTLDTMGSQLGVLNSDGTVSYVPDFGVSLNSIDVHQSKLNADGTYSPGIDASGILTFRGLEGSVKGTVPLLYPFKLPDAPLVVALDVPETKLTSLQALFPGLDTAASEGSVLGHVGVHGLIDSLAFDGGLNLNAAKLGFKGLDDRFHDVEAALKLSGNDLIATGKAAANSGGDILLNATAVTPGVRRIIEDLEAGTPDEIWASPLKGNFSLSTLKLDETLPGKGKFMGMLDGGLNLGGTIQEPEIDGKVALSNGKISLPTQEITPKAAPEYAIDPHFNVALNVTKSINVRSSQANIDLGGSGSVGGSLKDPKLSANLTVQKGTFQLPTARVTLDPDGSVRPSYTDGDGHIDVDLSGRTRVMAKGVNDRLQPYAVRMTIRGDLLQDSGLTLDATSSPPDLDRDQILALVGQTGALQGLTSIGSGGQTESAIRTALAGFALPSLLNPITGRIGEAFGLDTLTLEYDMANQASVVLGGALGRDFSFTASRQITASLPGLKPMFDYELTYRSPKLARFAFSLGADQDHPFKVSVEYGFRF